MFYLTAIFHHSIVFLIKTLFGPLYLHPMRSLRRQHIFGYFVIICVLMVFSALSFAGDALRPAVFAGRFYPNDPQALTDLIEKYAAEAANDSPSILPGQKLTALILPHAGYVYSGLVAAHAGRALKNQTIKKIILMGPDHRIGFSDSAIPDASFFQTPLGKIPISPDAARLIQQQPALFHVLPLSMDREHSLELVLPLLQHFLDEFDLVPITTGNTDSRALAAAIDPIRDPETLLVASSDLSHYLPYDAAKQKDQKTIRQILALDAAALSREHNVACGILPIQTILHLARQHGWSPVLLAYANSGDTAGPKDRVVGYTAIAFYEKKTANFEKGSQPMDQSQGDVLLKVARKTIADKLHAPLANANVPENELSKTIFNEQRGTFVTLKINDQLRGCIGNLLPDKSIIDGVRDNAINAAFHDPRFPPLSKDELDRVAIEISLLTRPEPLEYNDSADLLAKLRPGVDGLIIRKGPYSATFLPQVWDQLPDKKAFLSHLCAKAGLGPDAWQRSDLEVMTYQVQYFEEAHPSGD